MQWTRIHNNRWALAKDKICSTYNGHTQRRRQKVYLLFKWNASIFLRIHAASICNSNFGNRTRKKFLLNTTNIISQLTRIVRLLYVRRRFSTMAVFVQYERYSLDTVVCDVNVLCFFFLLQFKCTWLQCFSSLGNFIGKTNCKQDNGVYANDAYGFIISIVRVLHGDWLECTMLCWLLFFCMPLNSNFNFIQFL